MLPGMSTRWQGVLESCRPASGDSHCVEVDSCLADKQGRSWLTELELPGAKRYNADAV